MAINLRMLEPCICSTFVADAARAEEARYTFKKSKGVSKAAPTSSQSSKAMSSKAATSKSKGKKKVSAVSTLTLIDEEEEDEEFNFDEESELISLKSKETN